MRRSQFNIKKRRKHSWERKNEQWNATQKRERTCLLPHSHVNRFLREDFSLSCPRCNRISGSDRCAIRCYFQQGHSLFNGISNDLVRWHLCIFHRLRHLIESFQLNETLHYLYSMVMMCSFASVIKKGRWRHELTLLYLIISSLIQCHKKKYSPFRLS